MILAKQELELILNFYFFTSTVEKRAPSTPAEMHRRSRKMVPFKLLNDETTPPPASTKKARCFHEYGGPKSREMEPTASHSMIDQFFIPDLRA